MTVVVDYQGLGGGIVVRCAPGSPDTGFAALAGAGFLVEQIRNTPGFLCRIDGRPGADRESCVNTPPASAYWSYWYAPRGGSWTYSQLGAGYRNPPEGSVDGWSFAEGSMDANHAPMPGVDPPAVVLTPTSPPTPKPMPKPTAERTPKPTPRAAGTAVPTEVLGQPSATPATGSASPTSSEVVLIPTVSSPLPSPPASEPVTDPGAPPAGTLIGIGLVVALAIGGLQVGRRHRSID